METAIFDDLNFTKSEVKVYLSLLEFGESTIGPISRESGVTPAKAYPLLEKLKQKGLITAITKNGIKHFQAFSPNSLYCYLNERINILKTKKEKFKKIMPKLVLMRGKETIPYSVVYETFNGIKTLYAEILDVLKHRKESFIGFTLGEEYLNKEANIFFKNYDAKRKALRINVRLLGLESQRPFLEKNYPLGSNTEIRYLSHSVPMGVIIWDDKVATLLWGKTPIAIVICSKQNAKAYRRFFEDMWKLAKR